MKLPPGWKVARELRRLREQVISAPSRVTRYFLTTPYYDQFLARQIVETRGHYPETSRIGIYLIFPQFGIKSSHLDALDYLGASGYAPLVVSNFPLSAADREKVLGRCWRLIERPNFGYDFGGYRDGVLALEGHLARLDRLVFLNDSCWFPLPGANDWLADAESLNLDFVGAASHLGMYRPDVEGFRTISWRYITTNRDFHYASFALSIGPKILHDDEFCAYWKHFRLSNDKRLTVLRGEVGLTQWVMRSGYSHGSTLDIGSLAGELSNISAQRLGEITKSLVSIEDSRMLTAKSAFLQSDDFSCQNSRIALIMTVVAREGASYALADYLMQEKRFAFFKKSPLWLNEESSDILLSLLQRLPEPVQSKLMGEALELRARKTQFAIPAVDGVLRTEARDMVESG